jgi:O-antigen/teichoic acid export membrane protein
VPVDRIKQLGKDSIIYGLGGILAKSISFFLLPIYTKIFTPSDYGTVEMLTVISSFLGAIMILGLDSAQSMFFFKIKKKGEGAQAILVTSILQLRLIWGLIIVVLATLLAPFLNYIFFEGLLSWEYFALAFGGTFLQQTTSQSAEVFRLLYKPWNYLGVTLFQAVLAAGSVLLCVVYYDSGIIGFFIGTFFASTVTSLWGWWQIRKYLNFKAWHTKWWPRLLRFGTPLVPMVLGLYVMNTSDRWFIQHYHGSAEMGIYSVGAKFAIFITLVVETFRKAWAPIAMDSMHSNDGVETFRMISRLYLGLGCIGAVILTIISPWLVQTFTSREEYYSSWPLVGVLAWQPIFYGFYLIAAGGIWKSEKTQLATFPMVGAGILNIVLNYLFVPNWGGMGAALSTVVSYFVWICVTIIISERLWKVSFPLVSLLSLAALSFTFVIWVTNFDGHHSILKMSLVGLVVVVILLFLTVDAKTRDVFKKRLSS